MNSLFWLRKPALIVPLVLAWILVSSIGCKREDSMTNGLSRKYNKKNEIDYDELFGVRDQTAPNELLRDWCRSPRNERPANTISEEFLQSITKGEVRFADLSDYRITSEVVDALLAGGSVEWLRLPVQLDATDLEWISEMSQLKGLSLSRSNLSGADLHKLGSLSNLLWMNLSWVEYSPHDFKTLPFFPKLQTLYLEGNVINDDCLGHLDSLKLPALRNLSLSATSVTDHGLSKLCSTYNLEFLSLYAVGGVTEESIVHIGRMTNLRLLAVGLSGICPRIESNAAVERLSQLLPKCKIDYGG